MPRLTAVFKWVFILITVACICLAWSYIDFQKFKHEPLHLNGNERIIQIEPGSSARSVVEMLEKEKIIDHKWGMLLILKQSGLSDRLQPGTVVLTSELTPMDLPQVLARVGKYARKSIQILPGMNLYEIGTRLQNLRIADRQIFLALAFDPARVAEAGIPAKSFEGYLATGAYTFEVSDTPEKMLAEMHKRWRDQWLSIVQKHRGAYEYARRLSLTDHDLVTLASIVEKEIIVDRERGIVARVFLNRIRKKMKLQSDPTCVYPPRHVGEKPTPERCHDVNNPYSTYVRTGLPPGPIGSASPKTLLAVLEPYDGPESTQILYFVARQDGSHTHYFSKTYAEHQVAVDYFLKHKKKAPHGTTQP